MLDIRVDNGLILLAVGGKLTEADYDEFEDDFESLLAENRGPLPCLIVLEPDFAGWNLPALWRDLKFDVLHGDAFSRIAVVGDKTWEEWGTKAAKPLFPQANMRFFPPTERAEAERWARGTP